MPDGTAFGNQFVDEEEGGPNPWDAFSNLTEGAETDDAPQAPDATVVPIRGEEAEAPPADGWPPEADYPVETDVAPDEEPEAPAAETEEQRLLAGRYQSVEQLEQGYRALQQQFTQDRMERQTLVQQMAQNEQLTNELMEYVVQARAAEDPEFADQLAQRQQMSTQLQEAVQTEVAPIQQQLQAQRAQAAMQSTILGFYRDHDLAPRSPEDIELGQHISQLNASGVPIDLTNRAHLERAYESQQDPQIAAMLRLNPKLIDAPSESIEQMRAQLGLAAPANGNGAQAAPPVPGQAPAARSPVRRRVDAAVESGSSGAPVPTAPGAQPTGDAFDEAMAAFIDRKPRSVLFGG